MGTLLIFLVFDLTNRISFESLTKWIKEIRNHHSESTILLLIGNKADLVVEREISWDTAKEFAAKAILFI